MANAFGMGTLLNPVKRKIFISYHHDNDQAYYNEFARFFSDQYDVVQDNSVDRIIDSDDTEYVMRRIRENYISGTSCTIVLCGPKTPWRKYVDWEIKATLDKQHGLTGIKLNNCVIDQQRRSIVPDRLHDNIVSGYAVWTSWESLTLDHFKACIETANAKSKGLIRNDRVMRSRNGG